MAINSIKEVTLFEHNFWLQVLGDDSRFIFNSLSPKETYFIKQASRFINLFDDLLQESRKTISDEILHKLNYKAYSAAMEIRELKLTILSKQIEDKIDINLSPTFINHMIKELEEYIFHVKVKLFNSEKAILWLIWIIWLYVFKLNLIIPKYILICIIRYKSTEAIFLYGSLNKIK